MPSSDLTIALRIAYRCADVSPAERDAVLAAMAAHSPAEEAESASRILHHRGQAAQAQMQLDQLLTSFPAAPRRTAA